MVTERDVRITLPDGAAVSAVEVLPDSPGDWRFLYAPGAGANVHDPFGKFACRELAERGVACVRFQFPYQEASRKSPDRPPVIEGTWRAAIEQFSGRRLVIGGRSMGGRVGSMVVAQNAWAHALALFAYPLHPPGKPDQRRTEHLPRITVPTIFISGTRDAFASPEELRDAAAQVPNSQVYLLEGADHGFSVSKSSGRTKQDVWREAVDVMWEWLQAL